MNKPSWAQMTLVTMMCDATPVKTLFVLFAGICMTCYYIEITFPPPKIFNKMIFSNNPKGHGLMAWLWLFRSPGQAKATIKPSS